MENKTITIALPAATSVSLSSAFSYAGRWEIGQGVSFSMRNRPAWLHQKMAKLLLGWQWVDNV